MVGRFGNKHECGPESSNFEYLNKNRIFEGKILKFKYLFIENYLHFFYIFSLKLPVFLNFSTLLQQQLLIGPLIDIVCRFVPRESNVNIGFYQENKSGYSVTANRVGLDAHLGGGHWGVVGY